MSIEPKWFSLFKNNNNIEEGISKDFKEILKNCKNPHIICIYGDARTGKSTKMNQIINGTKSENYFDLKTPFKTLREIHTTMTKGCNFYGPIKAGKIANLNNLNKSDYEEIENDELFFVDTEGLNSIDETTKSCVSGILTILQVAAIKILYIPFLDNEKLDDAVNNTKLTNILNFSVNESKVIVLIRDIPLNEKRVERRMFTELDYQKSIFENKINDYLEKNGEITKVICEILPSFDLAADKEGPFRVCYKAQMENVVFVILNNIKHYKDMNGEKLLGIMTEFLDIFMKIKNIESLRSTKNALNSILSELFKEKINKVYLNLENKINNFDNEVICLNGKLESIKNYLFEKLKQELKNTFQIYDKTIHDEIKKQIDYFGLKLENDIKSIFDKKKNEINNEIFIITDIKNNKEMMDYLNKIDYKEGIDKNKINSILQKIIDTFLNKYNLYFQYIEITDKHNKNRIIDKIKESANNNINYIINSKQKWSDYLKKIIFEIQTEIANPYKNEIKKQSIEVMNTHIKNNLDQMSKKIEIFLAKKRIKVFKVNDLNDEINKLKASIKEELSNQINIEELSNQIKIKGKIKKNEQDQTAKEIMPIIKICSMCNVNKCIDTRSLEYLSGTQIWDSILDKKNQIFVLEKSKTKNGFLLIKNHFSGLYLGMENCGGWTIRMRKKGENNQNFKLIDCNDGFFIIENETGYVIDLGNWITNNGNIVGACKKSGSSAQKWKIYYL